MVVKSSRRDAPPPRDACATAQSIRDEADYSASQTETTVQIALTARARQQGQNPHVD